MEYRIQGRIHGQWKATLDGVIYPVVHNVDCDFKTNFHSCFYSDPNHPQVQELIGLVLEKKKVIVQKSFIHPFRVSRSGDRSISCRGYVGLFEIFNIIWDKQILTFNFSLLKRLGYNR
jgi:hypothetical protein